MTGSDAYGAFHPDQSITRAEAAAILNRLLNPAKRKTFTLQQPSPMQSLDLTKAWSCSEWINREQYVTSLAFFADGSLYGLYYIPNSSFSMSMRGTYTAEGNTLRLNVYWAEGASPPATYTMEKTDSGFRLTVTSAQALYQYHQQGDTFLFTPDQAMTAQQCKAACLQRWGWESM